MPQVALIAAVAQNGIIGKNNALPWHLPEDLRHFKAMTTGHTVVMGRRTYASLPRRLPNRRMVVLSRQLQAAAAAHQGVEIYPSWAALWPQVRSDEQVFIIGGAALYAEALAFADRVLLTEIAQDFDGDVAFPSFPLASNIWQETRRETAVSASGLGYAFVTYERAICRSE